MTCIDTVFSQFSTPKGNAGVEVLEGNHAHLRLVLLINNSSTLSQKSFETFCHFKLQIFFVEAVSIAEFSQDINILVINRNTGYVLVTFIEFTF